METKSSWTILPGGLLILFVSFYKRRNILLIIILGQLVSLGSQVRAQSIDIPQSEFSLYESSGTMEVKKGDTLEFEILILKSKSYQKSKSKMGISSNLPEGMTVRFDPEQGLIERSNVWITVSDVVPSGFYNLVFNCTMRYRTKGIVVKIVVP